MPNYQLSPPWRNLLLHLSASRNSHFHPSWGAACCYDVSKLREIHSFLLTSGFPHPSLSRLLLLCCLSLPSFPAAYAISLFRQTPHPGIFIYNALIRGFSFLPNTSVSFYVTMRKEGIFPNKHTFPLLLKSDSRVSFQIFSEAIKLGFGFDHFFRNSLLACFANHGLVKCARQVFDETLHKDVVAYTALMDCYIKNSRPLEALEIFLEMRRSGSRVDEVAVVSSLSAAGMSGRLWFGRWIHGFYIVSGRVPWDVYVGSALVDMYSKCVCCDDALKAFLGAPYRNVVSWSALLAGYVQCHRFRDVLSLFMNMLTERVKPNEPVLATVLTACAQLGALAQGIWIHKYIGSQKLHINSILGTALIDMYAKCGCINEARLVFDKLHMQDVYPCTALVFGLAMNGDAAGSLNLFQQMVRNGVKPNEVTFIAVLSACAHAGYVTDGQEIFASMEIDHGVKPTADHYGCMVDLLGRAGKLREALELIRGMPMVPNARIWGSLFGSCMIQKDLELGKRIGNHMIEMQPEHSGAYALLVNLYSKNGRWEAACEIRRKMRESGVWKIPGCSWIDLNGQVHEFTVTDNSHLASNKVYGVLDNITAHMMQQQLPFCLDKHIEY